MPNPGKTQEGGLKYPGPEQKVWDTPSKHFGVKWLFLGRDSELAGVYYMQYNDGGPEDFNSKVQIKFSRILHIF